MKRLDARFAFALCAFLIGCLRLLSGCQWFVAHEAQIEGALHTVDAVACAGSASKKIDTGVAGVFADVCKGANVAEEVENEAAVRGAVAAVPPAAPSVVIHKPVSHPSGRTAGMLHDQRAVMKVAFPVPDARPVDAGKDGAP